MLWDVYDRRGDRVSDKEMKIKEVRGEIILFAITILLTVTTRIGLLFSFFSILVGSRLILYILIGTTDVDKQLDFLDDVWDYLYHSDFRYVIVGIGIFIFWILTILITDFMIFMYLTTTDEVVIGLILVEHRLLIHIISQYIYWNLVIHTITDTYKFWYSNEPPWEGILPEAADKLALYAKKSDLNGFTRITIFAITAYGLYYIMMYDMLNIPFIIALFMILGSMFISISNQGSNISFRFEEFQSEVLYKEERIYYCSSCGEEFILSAACDQHTIICEFNPESKYYRG